MRYANRAFILIIAGPALLFGFCEKDRSQRQSEIPAKIENPVKETDLTTVRLSDKAVSRLGIEIAAVEYRDVNRTRTYGGEVEVVSGRAISLSAPLPGVVLTPRGGRAPSAGQRVVKGQSICLLALLPPEKEMLGAAEEVALKKSQLDVAQSRMARAEKLLRNKAGSIKELEQARADLAGAKAALRVAQARLDILQGIDIASAAEKLSSLNIESPVDGIIQKVHVTTGQTVGAGTPLLVVCGINPLWVRVPVYVGDLDVIDERRPARLQQLSDFKGQNVRTASPVPSPYTANPASASADLYYELSNQDLKLRPGQKVSVSISLRESEGRLVVPYSSILYDMHGGTWVYENTEPLTYVRRRLELANISGEWAVISRGLSAGARVVTAGATELYGTEFGIGK